MAERLFLHYRGGSNLIWLNGAPLPDDDASEKRVICHLSAGVRWWKKVYKKESDACVCLMRLRRRRRENRWAMSVRPSFVIMRKCIYGLQTEEDRGFEIAALSRELCSRYVCATFLEL